MVTNETQEQLEARGWDFTEEFIPDEPTVNNQDKTVDVSENGTIEVTPDEGFTGLGKVTVNTNVESGGSKYVYYDLRNASPDAKGIFLLYCALMVRFDGADMYTIPPLLVGSEGLDDAFIKKTLAAMTDLDLEIDFGEGLMKVRDVMSMGGLTFPEITKEQFYNLNA